MLCCNTVCWWHIAAAQAPVTPEPLAPKPDTKEKANKAEAVKKVKKKLAKKAVALAAFKKPADTSRTKADKVEAANGKPDSQPSSQTESANKASKPVEKDKTSTKELVEEPKQEPSKTEAQKAQPVEKVKSEGKKATKKGATKADDSKADQPKDTAAEKVDGPKPAVGKSKDDSTKLVTPIEEVKPAKEEPAATNNTTSVIKEQQDNNNTSTPKDSEAGPAKKKKRRKRVKEAKPVPSEEKETEPAQTSDTAKPIAEEKSQPIETLITAELEKPTAKASEPEKPPVENKDKAPQTSESAAIVKPLQSEKSVASTSSKPSTSPRKGPTKTAGLFKKAVNTKIKSLKKREKTATSLKSEPSTLVDPIDQVVQANATTEFSFDEIHDSSDEELPAHIKLLASSEPEKPKPKKTLFSIFDVFNLAKHIPKQKGPPPPLTPDFDDISVDSVPLYSSPASPSYSRTSTPRKCACELVPA